MIGLCCLCNGQGALCQRCRCVKAGVRCHNCRAAVCQNGGAAVVASAGSRPSQANSVSSKLTLVDEGLQKSRRSDVPSEYTFEEQHAQKDDSGTRNDLHKKKIRKRRKLQKSHTHEEGFIATGEQKEWDHSTLAELLKKLQKEVTELRESFRVTENDTAETLKEMEVQLATVTNAKAELSALKSVQGVNTKESAETIRSWTNELAIANKEVARCNNTNAHLTGLVASAEDRVKVATQTASQTEQFLKSFDNRTSSGSHSPYQSGFMEKGCQSGDDATLLKRARDLLDETTGLQKGVLELRLNEVREENITLRSMLNQKRDSIKSSRPPTNEGLETLREQITAMQQESASTKKLYDQTLVTTRKQVAEAEEREEVSKRQLEIVTDQLEANSSDSLQSMNSLMTRIVQELTDTRRDLNIAQTRLAEIDDPEKGRDITDMRLSNFVCRQQALTTENDSLQAMNKVTKHGDSPNESILQNSLEVLRRQIEALEKDLTRTKKQGRHSISELQEQLNDTISHGQEAILQVQMLKAGAPDIKSPYQEIIQSMSDELKRTREQLSDIDRRDE